MVSIQTTGKLFRPHFTTTATTEKSQFIAHLRAVSVFSQGNNSVKFEFFFKKQQVVLAAESSDLG